MLLAGNNGEMVSVERCMVDDSVETWANPQFRIHLTYEEGLGHGRVKCVMG